MTKRRLSTSQSANLSKRFNAGEKPFDNGLREISSAVNYLDSGEIDTTETIQLATTMLNKLDEIYANILAIRARALGRQAKFAKAIADASRAIDTCPTSGKLYVLASQLHTDHGKSKLAIDVLEKGLRSVLPSEWPPLYEQREAAKRLLETKVDFIAVLPSEISTAILGWLRDMDVQNKEIFGCTMMSRKWRASVLGCAQLWEVAKYNKGANDAFQLLPSVCYHVEELNIKNLPEQQSRALTKLAIQGALQSTTKLSYRHVLSNIPLRLMSALGQQITELNLDIIPGVMRRQNNVLVLDDILEPCKNLKLLAIQYSGPNIQYQPSQPPTLDALQLEVLSIRSAGNDSDVLRQLILRCPQLQYLGVAHCTPDILELVSEHCLQLATFNIDDTPFLRRSYPSMVPPKINEHGRSRNELTSLVYVSATGISELQGLEPMWDKWKQTLQVLSLEVDIHSIETMEPEHWESLVCRPYPKLKTLILSFLDDPDDHAISQLSRLLESCPNVEDVCVTFDDISFVDFSTSIAKLKYLRQLSVNCKQAGAELQRLFEHLSTQAQKCALKEIQCDDCDGMTDVDLSALADIVTLEKVTICGLHPFISSSGLTTFIQKLKSNPNLQSFNFCGLENFTDDCMPALDGLVGLSGAKSKYYFQKIKKIDDTYDIIFERRKHY